MPIHSKRPIKFLLVSVSLAVIGCAETPKAPISYNNQSAITVTHQEPVKTYDNLSGGRLKTAQSHKGTVWERLLSLYALPEIDNDRVQRQLNWYLDHPAYIARVQQRAEPYLHLILDEIQNNNIPGELALLPIVESAFIPDAYSKADASGLWQFIPDTGRLYGLEQNSWYDGRRDILDSTQAAVAFLKDLGETFNGDWLLALASYNCGKGNVWKAMERNEMAGLSTEYWSLNLPKETEDYVPRLLAVAKLVANADEYGIALNNIPDKPYIEVVSIDSALDLTKAAQLANMPYDKFIKLNPGYNRSTTPEGGHRLLVPVDKAEQFKTSLAQLPLDQRVDQNQLAREQEERELIAEARRERAEAQRELKEQQKAASYSAHRRTTFVASNSHKVKSGETLTAIASKNHTTVAALLKANPNIKKSVQSGAVIKVPSHKEAIQVAKNGKHKSDFIQVASAKRSAYDAKPSKADKQQKSAFKAVLEKKSKSSNAVFTASTKGNYRKANVALADSKNRNNKKLKRT